MLQQIEKCATNKQWLEDNLIRQSEKPKNVNPVITTAEIYKRRDDVQFSSAAIMNKPKPKPKTEVPPPAEAPKEEKAEETEPEITEMDVGTSIGWQPEDIRLELTCLDSCRLNITNSKSRCIIRSSSGSYHRHMTSVVGANE